MEGKGIHTTWNGVGVGGGGGGPNGRRCWCEDKHTHNHTLHYITRTSWTSRRMETAEFVNRRAPATRWIEVVFEVDLAMLWRER